MVASTRAAASAAILLSFGAGACGGSVAKPAAGPSPVTAVTIASAAPAPAPAPAAAPAPAPAASAAASAKLADAPAPDALAPPTEIPNTSIQFKGGDGSSVAHAVLIHGAHKEKDGVAAEYWYVSHLLGVHGVDWHVHMQALLNKNGHAYDMLEVASHGATRRFYFDISEFFGHF